MNNSKLGEFKLIIGPMYAGKSTELIRFINQYKFLKCKVLCVNHSINVRYGSNNIITHNKVEVDECISVNSVSEIRNNDNYESSDVIIIEEIQFFKDAYEEIKIMVDQDCKTVVAAGLSSDFNREPFGDVLKLITIADSVTQLTALCSKCHNGTVAPFTKRCVNNSEKELVGSYGLYEAVCRYHYFND